MTGKLKALLTALAVVVLATALLVPIAGASGSTPGGMMGSPSPRPTMMGTPAPSPSPTGNTRDGSWCGGGMWGGSGAWGGTGMWGTGMGTGWLTSNADALQAWLQLRSDHLAGMQAWYNAYRADLRSPAAQQALHDVWTKTWNDMKTFYEQHADGAAWTCPSDGMWGGWDDGMMGHNDWDASHMWGTGHGASWMTGHPGAFGQWMTMRARQTAAVTAWQQHYAGNLAGSAAQTAMQTMHSQMREQVKHFYRNHHLTVTTGRVRDGAGGWMGLGGMWGGFGW